nr:hypothetical protein [Tanacetum cinerariifolium]
MSLVLSTTFTDYVLEFVPEPIYLEFMPPKDDVPPAKEQLLPAAILPTADSPGYILESDPEENHKEDDEDPKEDPADYPTDREDDDDDEEESSRDDADDEEEDKDEVEEEEEEHLAPADSVPPPVHHVTARMSVQAQTSISLLSETEVSRLLSIPTPPPSPLSPLSSPLPYVPSPPLPISPLPLPASPTYSLGYKASMIRLRAESISTSHPLPSTDVPEVILTPRKRLCIALALRFEVSESSSTPTARPTGSFRAGYEFVGTLDDEIRRDPKRERMTDFVTTVREDSDEIYVRLDDAHDDRLLMSGQLNMLRRDRRAHACIARLMESETRLSCKAWVQSMDASNITRAKVMSLHTIVTTRLTPATTTTTTTTPVTNAQLKALIDQGIADALIARDTDRSRNGKDNHDSGPARECT